MKAALLLIIPLLLVAGCISQDYGTTGGTETGSQQGGEGPLYNPHEGGPFIEIITPVNGAVIENTSIVGVTVRVSGFNLVDVPADRQNRAGYGHVTYVLDGTVQHKSPYISDSFANVDDGVHTIRAELRNNDDTPLAIPVFDEVTVTVA